MPTVPRRNPNSYVPPGSTPTLRPGNAFTPAEPIPIGPAVQQISRIIEQKIQRTEEIQLLEADNQLADAATNLRLSALQKRGKDALAAGPQVQEDWEKTVSEVESSLSSDRQRENFRLRAQQRWQQLNATVQTHGAEQFKKYEAEQTEIGLSKRAEEAVNNYADPKAVRQAVAESKYLVELYGTSNGFSPEQIEEKQLAATTRIHAAVIARMVADGKDIAAVDYFKQAKPEIDSEAITKLTQALEVSSTEGEALRGAGEIWKRLGPKAINDPVTLSQMEQDAREKYAANPKLVKAVIQELRMRREAHNSEQAEVGASNKAFILGGYAKGESVQRLVRTPQYLALSGTEQEQVKSYMIRDQRAEANRAPDKKNWEAYWRYSDPTVLSKMSDNQVFALAPEIGQGLVNQLMQQKRSVLKTDDDVREATIDADQFRVIAEDADLDPYNKDNAPDLGRLKSTVEMEIDRAQQQLKRKLTRDEKQKIMQGVIDNKVMLDFRFSTGTQIAALVEKDDRDNAFIPINRVSRQFVTLAVDWMRQNGNAMPAENETQVMNRFQKRIEKAYAARILGRPQTEIANILAGR